MKFLPGPGVGGHCIPIDPHYLAWKMRGLNYKTRFIDLAGEVNSEMPLFWVRKLAELLNDVGRAVKGSRVLVVGVAYKKDIDDLRESPALDIIRLLESQGAHVLYHDPFVSRFTEDGTTLVSQPLTAETLRGVDAVMVVTDHTGLDYRLIRESGRVVVDTRHVLARAR
jgi:UDP-N-acetyl-D-glucosamine dehydrogenase